MEEESIPREEFVSVPTLEEGLVIVNKTFENYLTITVLPEDPPSPAPRTIVLQITESQNGDYIRGDYHKVKITVQDVSISILGNYKPSS